jgi:membrane-associated phospholipid phosphatase
MGVVYAVNAVAVGVMTLYWKVSIHTALYSSIITVIVVLFGIQYAWGYLLIIPLAWSRIYRHRHSLNQVIGGAMIAFILTSLVFWFFGYL